jgi:hypothetical protein
MNNSTLETEVIRSASREGVLLRQRYGCMPPLARVVDAILASGEPWLDEIQGDRRAQITTILRGHLERNGSTTTLGKRRRKRR